MTKPRTIILAITGNGKSSVREELLRRGYKAYGGAEDNIAAFYNNETLKQRLASRTNKTPDELHEFISSVEE